MSFHIIITCVCLLALLIHAGAVARARCAGRPSPWWCYPTVIALCLPLAVGIIIPISQYLMAFSTVSALRFVNVIAFAIFGGAIWAVAGSRLRSCARADVRPIELTCLWTAWGLLGFWYFLGVAITHRELGRTPRVGDSGFYVMHLISVHALILTLFIA